MGNVEVTKVIGGDKSGKTSFLFEMTGSLMANVDEQVALLFSSDELSNEDVFSRLRDIVIERDINIVAEGNDVSVTSVENFEESYSFLTKSVSDDVPVYIFLDYHNRDNIKRVLNNIKENNTNHNVKVVVSILSNTGEGLREEVVDLKDMVLTN